MSRVLAQILGHRAHESSARSRNHRGSAGRAFLLHRDADDVLQPRRGLSDSREGGDVDHVADDQAVAVAVSRLDAPFAMHHDQYLAHVVRVPVGTCSRLEEDV